MRLFCRNISIFCIFFFLLAMLPACSPTGTPDVRIERQKAWVSPVLVGVVSVFMDIVNAGDGRDALMGAGMDLPGVVVELHDTNRGRMVKADMIPVPSRRTVELQPGGKHIMVFKLPPEVVVGTEVALRLRFRESGEKLVTVPVVAAEPAGK